MKHQEYGCGHQNNANFRLLSKTLVLSVLLTCALLSTSGCAHVTGGNKITPEAIAFFQQGSTPYSEVVTTLGQPNVDLDLPGGRLIAYFWEIMKDDGATLTVLGKPVKEWDQTQRRYLLCIEFDPSNTLKRFETVQTFKGETLAERALSWKGQHQQFIGGTSSSGIEGH